MVYTQRPRQRYLRAFLFGTVLSCVLLFSTASPALALMSATDKQAYDAARVASEAAARKEPRLQIQPTFTEPAERATAPNNTTDGITHCGIEASRTGVWLTFDDSGTTSQVQNLLSILRKYNVRATFFPTGQFAVDRPDLITLMKNEGHIVGSHSYSHPDLMTLSTTGIKSEITRAEAAIKPYPSNRRVFRAPYGSGSFSSTLNSILTSYNYQNCFWTVDTRDWAGTSASSMLANVKANTRARGVILFHMHGKYTASVLPSVIGYLKTTGYGLPKLY